MLYDSNFISQPYNGAVVLPCPAAAASLLLRPANSQGLPNSQK